MKKLFSICISLLFSIMLVAGGQEMNSNNKTFQGVTSESNPSYPVTPFFSLASQYEPGYPLSNTYDSNLSTFFYSKSGALLPDTLDYIFKDVQRIDSLIYYPITAQTGRFGNTSIYYAQSSNPDVFIKLMDKDFGMPSTAVRLALNGASGITNPCVVRIIVMSGKNNYASCAEMQFNSLVQQLDPCSITSVPTITNTKLSIQSAWASSQETTQGSYGVEKSFDNNTSTYYSSQFGLATFPDTLDYHFTGVDRVDYLMYTPKAGVNPQGNFQQTEIWYSTINAPTTFAKLCDYNFNAPSSVLKYILPSSIINPATIRIIVLKGYNDRATCAEMAFYKSTEFEPAIFNVFKDNIFSWIKPDVTQTDIDIMPSGFYKDLAQCMYNGTYDSLYRVQNYEPYPVISTTASAMKTSSYSPYENPTGIYFENATTAVIFVENTWGQSISLKIRMYYPTGSSVTSYPLSNGLNQIAITQNGLGYISYYTDSYATLKPVRIHIVSGKLNRYYDVTKTSKSSWVVMSNTNVTEMIDIKGKYVGLLWPVASLKLYNPTDLKPWVQLYDSIVKIEHEQMGLYKYNKVPKNHMYGEGDDSATFSWYAGGDGAHFSSSISATADPIALKSNPWGIAHEFGHVNQIRPGLKWSGTTEVTNNIYSALVTYKLSPQNSYLETRSTRDAYLDGTETGTGYGLANTMIGGRFNSYLNNALIKKQLWMFQYGADNMKSTGTETWADSGSGGDFFVRLCPLWQLVLYYQYAHPDKSDWYKDIAEKTRNTNLTGVTNGNLQLNFIKNTCDAVQEDVSDFFIKIGMFRCINTMIGDYGQYTHIITESDSTAAMNYIKAKNYPKPESPVIQYISVNSINAYLNKLPVVGTANTGCLLTTVDATYGGYKNYVTVDHAIWKNVVAFETYNSNTLVRLSMVSSGYADNSKTRVYFPTGATSIYAIAWDGTKTLVYGTETALSSNTILPVDIIPNPAKDVFRVSGLTDKATLIITNLCGKQMLTKKVDNNEHVFLNSFPSGVYLVQITSANGTAFKKLIKE